MRAHRTLSILRAAAEEPDRPALIDAGKTVSFAELADQTRSAIAELDHRGLLEPGTPVGLLGTATRKALVVLYALLETGVPVAMIHPRSTPAERRRLLADTQSEDWLDPANPKLWEAPATTAEREYPEIDDERPLAIVQTSGTRGRPKAVVLSRRAFAAAAAASAANLGWRDDDRWLLSLPIAHVGGLSIVTRCLMARQPVVLEPLPRFDAVAVSGMLERRRITLLSLVPTMLGRLLDLDNSRPPGHLRAVLVGGAAATAGLLERAAQRGWPVLATYGLTEACSQVATQPYGAPSKRRTGCGPPVTGMEIRIRDGAIEIRGPSLLSGYLPPGDPPALAADGWLRTGDLGRLDRDGHLHVLGRADEVIVSGGENVHPLEVESALTEHPRISEACVFGTPDPEWGETVAAALVAPHPPDADDLIRFLKDRVAAYKRPRRLAYLSALPKRASGKLDRVAAATQARPHLRPWPGRQT